MSLILDNFMNIPTFEYRAKIVISQPGERSNELEFTRFTQTASMATLELTAPRTWLALGPSNSDAMIQVPIQTYDRAIGSVGDRSQCSVYGANSTRTCEIDRSTGRCGAAAIRVFLDDGLVSAGALMSCLKVIYTTIKSNRYGEPGWDRTIDPLIKSQMLYP